MKPERESNAVEPEKLKPILHLKIERMDPQQLTILNRVLLQLEAEELGEQLGESFDRDQGEGKMRRIPELVRLSRSAHPYQ